MAKSYSLKGARSASQKSDILQIPRDLLEESVRLIHQELEEWEDAVSEISRQAEVLGEIGSLIRDRISSLQKAASSPGKLWAKPPQFGLPEFEQELAEVDPSPALAVPTAEAEVTQAAPAPSQLGPGSIFGQSITQGLANQVAWGNLQDGGTTQVTGNLWTITTGGSTSNE